MQTSQRDFPHGMTLWLLGGSNVLCCCFVKHSHLARRSTDVWKRQASRRASSLARAKLSTSSFSCRILCSREWRSWSPLASCLFKEATRSWLASYFPRISCRGDKQQALCFTRHAEKTLGMQIQLQQKNEPHRPAPDGLGRSVCNSTVPVFLALVIFFKIKFLAFMNRALPESTGNACCKCRNGGNCNCRTTGGGQRRGVADYMPTAQTLMEKL